MARRPLEEGPIEDILDAVPSLPEATSPGMAAGREAIMGLVKDACGVELPDALEVQAKRAADFLAGPECRKGAVGADWAKTTKV